MTTATPQRLTAILYREDIAVIWRWGHWEACFARQASTRKRSSMSSDALFRGT